MKKDLKYRSINCFLLLMFFSFGSIAQQRNYTMSRDFLWTLEKNLNSTSRKQQTFVKPYRYVNVQNLNDSILSFSTLFPKKKNKEEVIPNKPSSFSIEALPLLNACIGSTLENSASMLYELGIGASFRGNLGKKLAFEINGFFQKANYPRFMDSVIADSRVIPGTGYAYAEGDSLDPTYNASYFSGYVSWSPNRIFNIQAGQDKHFWGDGYRSLLLSDNAAPYPFLKISTNIWRLTYVNLYTIMRDATAPSSFKKDWLYKYTTTHYLGWNATKRIQIGLFESIVWQGSDSTRNRGYDINYLNPVLFFRPAEYSVGSSDNACFGLNFKLKLFKKIQVYGQVFLDEFVLKELRSGKGWWANKYAFQGGFKVFDLFGLQNLNIQSEVNYSRPYTYSHGSVQQNYSHMNQPLAHPLGANFTEFVSFLNYRTGRLFMELKFIYAEYGGDSSGANYGKNIFLSYSSRNTEYYNYTGQGIYNKLITLSARAAYLIDADLNLKIEMGVADRIHQIGSTGNHLPFIYIGIRTDLSNLYNDF